MIDALESYPTACAGLIASLDRCMGAEEQEECVALAYALRAQGWRVVGVDLCGDRLAGDMVLLTPISRRRRHLGRG